MSGKTLLPVILLIENEETDVFLFRRVLAISGFQGTVHVASSVAIARDYFEGNGPYADRDQYPFPDLIVSDMSLAGEVGNDFLEWLRRQPEYLRIPFVFLTGTFIPQEFARAGQLGVDQYVHKTGDLQELQERVELILKFLPRPSE
jgi:CheY-like chemotaxis protein